MMLKGVQVRVLVHMSVCDSCSAVKPAFPLWGVCGHDVLLPCDCVCLHTTVDGRGSERWRRSSSTEAETAAITLSKKKTDRMSEEKETNKTSERI